MPRRDTPWRRLRYRTLSRLPGQTGLDYARKLRKLDAPRAQAEFRAALAAAKGGVCVDLGANLGEWTVEMARHAGRVYAFEPDPWTAERLRARVAGLGNVEVIEAAAGTEDGTIALYRSPEFEADPDLASQSASILAEKRNVDTAAAVDVRVVDFARWLEALGQDVAVIKIDIEGAEVALLERLFDSPALARVGHVFVETHESRIPELATRTEALRRRAAAMTRPVVNMDWK